jgi:hypothetical protein
MGDADPAVATEHQQYDRRDESGVSAFEWGVVEAVGGDD